MKSIVRSLASLALALVAACAVPVTAPSHEPLMSDPLLGLPFDPYTTRFEQFPYTRSVAELSQRKPQWIFASYRDTKSRDTYWIVSGYQEVKPDDNGGNAKVHLEPDFGAVVRISQARWTVLGTPDRLFDTQQPLLAPEILHGLVRDAAVRYVRAFGGANKLSTEIEQQKGVADEAPRSLVDELIQRGVRITLTKR